MLSEFVQEFCFQMVFACILSAAQHTSAGLHGADVGLCADLRSASHGVLFVCVFDYAHVIQRPAEVALFCWALHAKTNARTHAVEPSVDLALQPFVGGKGVPHALLVFQQFGHVRV